MRKYILTDLACENEEIEEKSQKKKVTQTEKIAEEIIKEKIETDHQSSQKRERAVIFHTPKIWTVSDSTFSLLQREIAKELFTIIKESVKEKNRLSLLTVGLGNSAISTDSLGSEVIKKINIFPNQKNKIYAINPDVSANTGIESSEYVSAFVKKLLPDAVIVVDSLASKSIDRLASTVQIANYGIIPGSGIGRDRSALNYDLLGIPVISIGIPTVINSSTLTVEVLKDAGIASVSDDIYRILEQRKSFFVTPQEIDITIKFGSYLLSGAINMALEM